MCECAMRLGGDLQGGGGPPRGEEDVRMCDAVRWDPSYWLGAGWGGASAHLGAQQALAVELHLEKADAGLSADGIDGCKELGATGGAAVGHQQNAVQRAWGGGDSGS